MTMFPENIGRNFEVSKTLRGNYSYIQTKHSRGRVEVPNANLQLHILYECNHQKQSSLARRHVHTETFALEKRDFVQLSSDKS